MPKPNTIARLDRPEDVASLDAQLTQIWSLLEAGYKQFVPSDAPEDAKDVTLYFDKATGKFKFARKDGTTETIQST